MDGWGTREGKKKQSLYTHTCNSSMCFVVIVGVVAFPREPSALFFDLHQSRRLCQPCVRVLLFLFFDIHPSTA